MLGNIITALIVIVALGSIVFAIIYKVRHKGCCGSGTSGCSGCSGCSVKDCPSRNKK